MYNPFSVLAPQKVNQPNNKKAIPTKEAKARPLVQQFTYSWHNLPGELVCLFFSNKFTTSNLNQIRLICKAWSRSFPFINFDSPTLSRGTQKLLSILQPSTITIKLEDFGFTFKTLASLQNYIVHLTLTSQEVNPQPRSTFQDPTKTPSGKYWGRGWNGSDFVIHFPEIHEDPVSLWTYRFRTCDVTLEYGPSDMFDNPSNLKTLYLFCHSEADRQKIEQSKYVKKKKQILPTIPLSNPNSWRVAQVLRLFEWKKLEKISWDSWGIPPLIIDQDLQSLLMKKQFSFRLRNPSLSRSMGYYFPPEFWSSLISFAYPPQLYGPGDISAEAFEVQNFSLLQHLEVNLGNNNPPLPSLPHLTSLVILNQQKHQQEPVISLKPLPNLRKIVVKGDNFPIDFSDGSSAELPFFEDFEVNLRFFDVPVDYNCFQCLKQLRIFICSTFFDYVFIESIPTLESLTLDLDHDNFDKKEESPSEGKKESISKVSGLRNGKISVLNIHFHFFREREWGFDSFSEDLSVYFFCGDWRKDGRLLRFEDDDWKMLRRACYGKEKRRVFKHYPEESLNGLIISDAGFEILKEQERSSILASVGNSENLSLQRYFEDPLS